jgi:hypothetical protein
MTFKNKSVNPNLKLYLAGKVQRIKGKEQRKEKKGQNIRAGVDIQMTGLSGKLPAFYLAGSNNDVEVDKGDKAANKYKRDYT